MKHVLRVRAPKSLRALAGGLLIAPLVAYIAPATVAQAEEPEAQPTFTAEPLPTWQTNGVVYAVETVGNVVYAGGNFTAVRPPGAPEGTSEVPRKNLVAFDATTGELLPFSHSFTSFDNPIPTSGSYDKTCSPSSRAGYYTCDTVYEIRASRDGSTIYVGGDFTQVDNQYRERVAAFSTAGDSLLPWRSDTINGRVRSLAVSGSTVYVGGGFTFVNGEPRTRLAAMDADTGALLPWAPRADALVLALEMAPDDSRVILGGQFDTVNEVAIRGLAAADATSGELTRWDSRPIPRYSATRYSYVTDLSVDEDTVYVSSNGEGGGVFDGRLSADPYTGELNWVDVCLGATWAIEVVDELVYSGSHAHDCSRTEGGFPESWNVRPPAVPRYYRLLAQKAKGPDGSAIQHWFPTTNGGIVGKLGPRDITHTGSQLWIAGEFTTVNGAPQMGLTRFGLAPAAPSYRPVRPDQPTAVSVRRGEVRLSFRATEDLDDERLSYTILRGRSASSAVPIATVEADSKPWSKPSLSFVDTDLTPGEWWTYQVQAVDPSGMTSNRSWSATVQVSDTTAVYPDTILQDNPDMYWRLDDAAGSTNAASLAGSRGTYAAGATAGGTGALGSIESPSVGASTSGSSTGVIGADTPVDGPGEFTAEAWFKTSSTQGGKIFGFGNSSLGTSSSYDRHVYMRTDGRLVFGVYPGRVETAVSSQSYNDGQWHHVAASLGAGGMRLQVDGAVVASRPEVTSAQSYSGFWRLGGDNINGWPNTGSRWFAGDLDEFAVYPVQLTTGQVASHYEVVYPDTEAPSVPANLRTTVAGRSAVVSWDPATDNRSVDGYRVHTSTVSGFEPTAGNRVATVDTTQVVLPDLADGRHYVKVVAVDAAGNASPASDQAAADIAGGDAYAEKVLDDGATQYWQLDDGPGSSTAAAVVGAGATVGTGVTRGADGSPARDDNKAFRSNGTVNGLVVSEGVESNPNPYTVELWFNTTTTQGGKIVGFGNAASGDSSNYDRHVYMLDDGKLRYGVWLGSAATVTSDEAYNDGAWHHLVASLGSDGLKLYVDGAVVGADSTVTSAQSYSGRWRLGGDSVWAGSSSKYFAGSLDEFAAYPSQLSDAAVARHYQLAQPDSNPPSAPTDLGGSVSGGDTVSLDWSDSTDDVGVVGYEVHRATSAGFTPSAGNRVGEPSTSDFTDSGVAEGTWFYKVVAKDASGNRSDASGALEVEVVAPDTQAPTAPSALDATVTDDQVQLTWAASTDNRGVDHYDVYRLADPSAPLTAAARVGSTGTETLTDTGVPTGEWHYRVVAVDAAGNESAPSGSARAVVLGDPVEILVDVTDDAWVDSTDPTRNRGNAWALTSDGSPEQSAFLRFDVAAAPAGKTLVSASLAVTTTDASWSGSDDDHRVSLTDGSGWTESGLTFTNRPGRAALLGTLAGGFGPSTRHLVTLTPGSFAAPGAVSMTIWTDSANGAQFVGSESPAASSRPQLVLTYR